MKNTPLLWEDDKNSPLSLEAFKQLPHEKREKLESLVSYGNEMLAKADEDIKNLKRLVKMMASVASINFIHQKLRNTAFKITIESALEHEMLTTAFVVTYARLFVSSSGASCISEKKIPKHLKKYHKELIEIRHQRYAHNGTHESINSSIDIGFSGEEFDVFVNYELGMYIGGRDEWGGLVQFVNEYVYDQIYKILDRLHEKTAHKWNFTKDSCHDINDE